MAKTAAFSAAGLKIYFQSKRANVDGKAASQLVQFIKGAKNALHVAIYDLKDKDILRALKEMSTKVALHIRYDGGKPASTGGKSTTVDPKSATASAIKAAGLGPFSQVIPESGHLMHNKFVVRDRTSVWTGSGNFTNGGLHLQDNNFLSIDSMALAEAYLKAFDELTAAGDKTPKGPPASVAVGGAHLTVRFSTKGREAEDIEASVAQALHGAGKVRLIAMLVSDPGIMQALFDLRHGDIKGVVDPHEMKVVMKPPKGKSKLDPKFFWFANGDKRFVAAPSHAFNGKQDKNDFMHNKVLIIDDKTVVTGSYNFSENAEHNDENLLILQSPEVAKAYTAYFDALFARYKKSGAKLPPA